MNLHLSYPKTWIVAALLAGTLSVSVQSTNHAGARDFTAFQVINERNIFDPNRRPRIVSRVNTPHVQKVVDSFSLVGTMSYSNILIAFFDGTGADYHKSLPAGSKIANYTIAEISHSGVKLVSGTNEIVLKVGMQMRRNEDGTWNASEAAVSYNAGSSSTRNTSFSERRSDFGGRNRSRTSGYSNNTTQRNTVNNAETVDSVAAPANLDPSDPVARMMLRRMQQDGGGAAPEAPDSQPPQNPPDENTPIPSNESPDATNAPADTNPNPNAQPERP